MADRYIDRLKGEASSDALVGLVYDCVLRDSQLDVLLAKVAERFGAVSAIIIYVDPANAVSAFSHSYGVIARPDVQLLYSRDFAAIDPAPAAMSNLRLGQAASTDILFANSMDRCTPFLEGFLHPLGLAGTLAGLVANEGGRLGFFAVHRPRNRRIFDELDVAAYESLMQHVVRMLQLRKTFYSMAGLLGAQDLALDQSGVGIMLFGTSRFLMHANAASREILARNDGLHINGHGVLIVQDSEARSAFEAAFSAAGDSIVIVPRQEEALPYVLRISGLRMSGDVNHRVIRIWDPHRDVSDPSTLLRVAFALTVSSAKLVSALLRGDTLETYAARNDLSRSTVKFHLNAAFNATGTRRQNELLRLAGRLVDDLGHHG